MTRDISDSVLSALSENVVYPFFAVELLFDGDQTLRLWTGQGTLVYQELEFFGTGNLLAFDTVEETSEIAAKGASVTLSGVPTEVISLALSEPYQGRKANIYLGTFQKGSILLESSSYILLEDGGRINLEDTSVNLTNIFTGYMDQMNIEEGPDTSTVILTIENKMIDLEKARTARFTSTYQKSLYPDDLGFDFVESLQTQEVFWGRTSS